MRDYSTRTTARPALDHSERSPRSVIQGSSATGDWTKTFDPFASPAETGSAFGPKNGSNKEAITRHRVIAKRMVAAPGDEPIRTDDNGFPINRHFRDVPQDAPEVLPEPGFEDEVVSFSLFAYLSRSDVTWNPSIVSVCKASLYCPTTEEYILPIIHGNDRVEWFVQISDEIQWEVEDRDTGAMRARVTMRAGDVAAMPADIRTAASRRSAPAPGVGERHRRPARAVREREDPPPPAVLADPPFKGRGRARADARRGSLASRCRRGLDAQRG